MLFSDPGAERTDGKKGGLHVYAISLFMSFLMAIFVLINEKLVKVVPIFTLLTL